MSKFKNYLSDSSSISLLISNLVVIILAIVQGWEMSTVLWVYWIQSIIIGFFQFLRILSLKQFSTKEFTINNQAVLPITRIKIFIAFFFAFHYGFFHFIYAIFLFGFLQPTKTFDFTYFFFGGFIFFINHFFSFWHNKIMDEQKPQNISTLVFSPYARIVPMHLIIIFGAILGQSALIIFLILKTFVDLLMHAIKHKVNYSLNLK